MLKLLNWRDLSCIQMQQEWPDHLMNVSNGKTCISRPIQLGQMHMLLFLVTFHVSGRMQKELTCLCIFNKQCYHKHHFRSNSDSIGSVHANRARTEGRPKGGADRTIYTSL